MVVEITKGFHNNLLQGLCLQFCSQNKGFLLQSSYNNNSFAIFVISYFDCIVGFPVGCCHCYCCVVHFVVAVVGLYYFLYFLVVSRINIDELFFQAAHITREMACKYNVWIQLLSIMITLKYNSFILKLAVAAEN